MGDWLYAFTVGGGVLIGIAIGVHVCGYLLSEWLRKR